MISIPLKKSFDKEWIQFRDGIELKIDYPTSKQEVKIANKFFGVGVRLAKNNSFDEFLSDESSLEALGYYVKCTIKDWRTVINDEVKDGLIDDKTGAIIPCAVLSGELDDSVYYPLASDPKLILELYNLIKTELEFTETDKKK